MSALMNPRVPAFRKRRISIVLAMTLAFPALAAHESQTDGEGCTISSDMSAGAAQQLAWHRQQTDAVALDSLTGFLRLFTTIADELAVQAENDRNTTSKP